MPKIDLLPCPFCGSPAKLCSAKANASGQIFVFWVHCDFRGDLNCDVIPTTPKFDTAEQAVKAWNTRASGLIPCSERLPEKDGNYLCISNNEYKILPYRNGEFYCVCFDSVLRCCNSSVTHWMPLPSMPEVTNNVD